MAHPSRPRALRHRSFNRLGARSNLREFFVRQADRLGGTSAERAVTFNGTTNLVTSVAHGFVTGKGPIQLANDGGALPTGLVEGALYWPIREDADTFRLATSRELAVRGIFIDFTGNGTGDSTAVYATSAEGLFERCKQMGLDYRTLQAANDIESL